MYFMYMRIPSTTAVINSAADDHRGSFSTA